MGMYIDVSFEDMLRVFDFYRVAKIERYLYDNYGMKRDRYLPNKITNILELVDTLPDPDYDKLNGFMDALTQPGDIQKALNKEFYLTDADWEEAARIRNGTTREYWWKNLGTVRRP